LLPTRTMESARRSAPCRWEMVSKNRWGCSSSRSRSVGAVVLAFGKRLSLSRQYLSIIEKGARSLDMSSLLRGLAEGSECARTGDEICLVGGLGGMNDRSTISVPPETSTLNVVSTLAPSLPFDPDAVVRPFFTNLNVRIMPMITRPIIRGIAAMLHIRAQAMGFLIEWPNLQKHLHAKRIGAARTCRHRRYG